MSKAKARNLKTQILESSVGYRLFQNLIAKPHAMTSLKDRYFPEVDVVACRVLDLGCGPANLLDSLGDPPYIEYVGFDPNPDYVETARRRFPQREFHVGTSETLASDIEGLFDLAIISGVLHHLDDDEVKVLVCFAAERLAQGGTVVTIDPVLLSKQNPIARLLAKSDRGRFVRTPDQYLSLLSSNFGVRNSEVVSGLLRVPYDHFVCVGVRKS